MFFWDFYLKKWTLIPIFWLELHVFVPLRETRFLFREFCTPLKDFRVVKKVPLLHALTRDLFLPKYPRGLEHQLMLL